MTRWARRPCERGYQARSNVEWYFALTRSMPQRRRCECRDANHHRMEDEAERQIDDSADDNGDDVILGAADRDWRCAGIFTAFECDPVIYRPGQHRPEQNNAAEIAVGAQMRKRPGLHADQHGVLEHAFDIAGDVSRRDHDAGGPHQRDDDVAGPARWIPQHDRTGRAISGKTISNENDADDRDQRKQAPVRPLADPRLDRSPAIAHGHKHMRTEKNDQAEDFERKTHTTALYVEFPSPVLVAWLRRPGRRIMAVAERLSMTVSGRSRRVCFAAREIARSINDRLAFAEGRHIAAHRGGAAVARNGCEHALHRLDRRALRIARDDHNLVAERLQP